MEVSTNVITAEDYFITAERDAIINFVATSDLFHHLTSFAEEIITTKAIAAKRVRLFFGSLSSAFLTSFAFIIIKRLITIMLPYFNYFLKLIIYFAYCFKARFLNETD